MARKSRSLRISTWSVAGAAQLLGVRQQVREQVGAGAGADVDRRARREAVGIEPASSRASQAHSSSTPVLRVHQLGLARREAEEGGRRSISTPSTTPLAAHVGGIAHQGGIDPGRDQLLVGEEGDRLDAVAEVAPELARA